MHRELSPESAVDAFIPRQERRKRAKQSHHLLSSSSAAAAAEMKRSKNAVMLLNELQPAGLRYETMVKSGTDHEPVYTANVSIHGQVFSGVGRTKREAKQRAAETALQSCVQFERPSLVQNHEIAHEGHWRQALRTVEDFTNDDSADGELPLPTPACLDGSSTFSFGCGTGTDVSTFPSKLFSQSSLWTQTLEDWPSLMQRNVDDDHHPRQCRWWSPAAVLGDLRPNVQYHRVDSVMVDPDQVNLDQIKAYRVKANRVNSDQIQAHWINFSRVEANLVDSDWVSLDRIDVDQVKADGVYLDQVKACRFKPNWVNSDLVESDPVNLDQVGTDHDQAKANLINPDRVSLDQIETDQLGLDRVDPDQGSPDPRPSGRRHIPVTLRAVVDGQEFIGHGRTLKRAKRHLAAQVLRTLFHFMHIGQKSFLGHKPPGLGLHHRSG